MASAYSDRQQYPPFYTLPPVTTTDTQGSRPTSAQSPWSATSQSSADHLSLTLPSISPGDLAEDPSLYERLQSPSIYLPEAPAAMPHPQPRHSAAIPSQSRRRTEIYSVPDSDPSDLFFNFEGDSQPQSPRPPVTRPSSIVDLTESSPLNMPATSRKRKSDGQEGQTTTKRRRGQTPLGSEEYVENGAVRSGNPKVEEVDLVDIDNDRKLEEFRVKQQAELIKQQNREKADKPQKLTDFQCIICLDSPTDLTVTHCGKSSSLL
jgi:hypothetical protein